MADRWDSALYEDRHSFVWKKAGDLIDLLDPQPGERILDLGCGTGHLTAQIAARVTSINVGEVIGLDASASMIAQARQNYPRLKFVLADARALTFEQPFDAVFSNAALHWIPDAAPVIAGVARALKPGGRFVLEMGGKGNIERIVAALTAVLGGKNPWYFPSAGEYASLLEEHGCEVQALWTIERWNKLDHPERGLREWLEMFAGVWFESIPVGDREPAVKEIESRLRPALWREGAWWADYRRLRVVARLR